MRWFARNRLVDVEGEGTVEFEWSTLTAVNEWIKHADAKIAVTLAFMAALAGGLVALIAERAVQGIAGGAILVVAGALVIATFSLGVAGLKARSGRSSGFINPLYFGDVARCYGGSCQDVDRFVADWAGLAVGRSEDRRDVLVRQIHANSIIADRKFRWANRALWCAMGAVAVSALAVGFVVAGI